MAHETGQFTSLRSRAKPRRSPAAAEAAPAPRGQSPPSGRAALRVLVVDDERLSRQTAVRQLQEAGFEAAAVDCAQRALDELGASPWDFVLCDLRLPGREGMDLLHTIRRQHPNVDVLAMTAYGAVEAAVGAMQQGAADYLTKPFRFPELEHRLRRLGELRQLRRELEASRARLPAPAEAAGDRESAPVLVGQAGERSRNRVFTMHLEGLERVALPEIVQAFEAELIRWAMERAGNQQKRAAELLGLPRTTLQSKLNREAGVAGNRPQDGAASGPGSHAGSLSGVDAPPAQAATG